MKIGRIIGQVLCTVILLSVAAPFFGLICGISMKESPLSHNLQTALFYLGVLIIFAGIYFGCKLIWKKM